MMGTEVLRPHDPLSADRLHTAPSSSSFQRRRNLRNLPNLIVDRRPYNNYNSSNNVHKKTSFSPKPDNRRRDGSRKTSPTSSSPPPHVTILRRGESLESLAKGGVTNNNNSRNGFNNNKSLKSPNSKTSDDTSSAGVHKKLKDHHKSNSRGYKSCDDVAVCGTRVVGPESPEMFPSDDVYAGSAFSLSPSPRSLPLPSFFCSNKVKSCDFAGDSETEMLEDSATIGLRRLLRLDE